MERVSIWHNPRCSKSREALKYLETKDLDITVFEYLKKPLVEEDIKEVLSMLGICAKDLLRTKEDVYKTLGLKEVNDEKQIIKSMCENPKLIERPIVIKGDDAVIARPLEKIETLF